MPPSEKSWPFNLSKNEMLQVRPLADTICHLAKDFVELYRPEWDSQTPQKSGEVRSWYLRRDAGLQAFARYEARLRLKKFAKNGFITGGDYFEALLQQDISQRGNHVINERNWKPYVDWRRETNPEFKQKLAVWISRKHRGGLASYHADTRIRLYAALYDRSEVPLEYCSEDFSAFFMSSIFQSKEWPRQGEAVGLENVRRWRRNLGLKLSKQVVVKLPHLSSVCTLGLPGKEDGVVIDKTCAKEIGLPIGFSASLLPIKERR